MAKSDSILRRTVKPRMIGLIGSALGIGIATLLLGIRDLPSILQASNAEMISLTGRALSLELPAVLALIGSLRERSMPLLIAGIVNIPVSLAIMPGLGAILLVVTPFYGWAFAGLVSTKNGLLTPQALIAGLISVVCFIGAVVLLSFPGNLACRGQPAEATILREGEITQEMQFNKITECRMVTGAGRGLLALGAISLGSTLVILSSSGKIFSGANPPSE